MFRFISEKGCIASYVNLHRHRDGRPSRRRVMESRCSPQGLFTRMTRCFLKNTGAIDSQYVLGVWHERVELEA